MTAPPLPVPGPNPGESPIVQLITGGAFDTIAVRTRDDRLARLHSQRDPVSEADRLLDPLYAAGPPHVVIVVGLGLGYILDAIERRPGQTKVVGLEPLPEAVAMMQSRRDWAAWTATRRLTLLTGPDYRGSTDAFRAIDVQSNDDPPVVVHPVLKREYPNAVARAHVVAEAIINGARANEEARRRFAGPYVVNTLENLQTLVAEGDAADLDGALSGLPAIVIAAGPSLDQNLDHLRRLQDRAVLVAVDTAVRPLMTAGIQPHVVVAVDPQEVNARHLLHLGDTSGMWLVAEASLDAGVFPGFTGRTFCFKVSDHQPWPWLRELGLDRGQLRAWGSVVTTAFDLACRAGCDPVVFAGTNLAYTNGLLYCRNSTYETDWLHLPTDTERAEALKNHVQERATVPVVDILDCQTSTTPAFMQFRDWLVSRAGEERGRRILNATGAGILRGENIEQVDLAQVEFQELPGDADGIQTRLARAWLRRRGRSATHASRTLPEQIQQRIESPLTACPPDLTAEPQRSWREFGGEAFPSALYLGALFGHLPADSQSRVAARHRVWLNAHPFDRDERELWNLIHQVGQTSSQTPGPRYDASVRPWQAPAGWTRHAAGRDAVTPVMPGTSGTVVPTPGAARDFHSPWYQHFNAARLAHLATLGLDLQAKTVLEVGAGEGDLTPFFIARDDAVLVSDVREENLGVLRARYGGHASVQVASVCLDPPPAIPLGAFDVVFCYGVLNHLSDPDEALAYLAACCSGVLLLDLSVHNDPEQTFQSAAKNPGIVSASIAGVFVRPGRQWVYERLCALFGHVYVPRTQPHHDNFPLDWSGPTPSGSRAVFVASRTTIDNPALVEGLPVGQSH
jgi:hypothetical protein